jgi:hypothetical protein
MISVHIEGSKRDEKAKTGRVGAGRRANEYHALGRRRIFGARVRL